MEGKQLAEGGLKLGSFPIRRKQQRKHFNTVNYGVTVSGMVSEHAQCKTHGNSPVWICHEDVIWSL